MALRAIFDFISIPQRAKCQRDEEHGTLEFGYAYGYGLVRDSSAIRRLSVRLAGAV